MNIQSLPRDPARVSVGPTVFVSYSTGEYIDDYKLSVEVVDEPQTDSGSV